jgi:hypothetical protein
MSKSQNVVSKSQKVVGRSSVFNKSKCLKLLHMITSECVYLEMSPEEPVIHSEEDVDILSCYFVRPN